MNVHDQNQNGYTRKLLLEVKKLKTFECFPIIIISNNILLQ